MRYIVTFKDRHVAHFMKDPTRKHLLACTPEWEMTHVSGWTRDSLMRAESVKQVQVIEG